MDGEMRVLLLLLVLALGHTWAAVNTSDCEQILPKRLSADNLDKVTGDWVLAFGTFGRSFIDTSTLKSVRLEFDLQPNATSMSFTERVMFSHGLCWKYSAQVNVTADAEHTFHTFNSSVEEKGVVQALDETSQMVFYETCENCMLLEYKGIGGHVLFNTRREGHHQNLDNLNEAQSKHDEVAECLGITGDKKYVYDATADLCPKGSS